MLSEPLIGRWAEESFYTFAPFNACHHPHPPSCPAAFPGEGKELASKQARKGERWEPRRDAEPGAEQSERGMKLDAECENRET